MPDAARQRAFALEIVEKLRAAGFEALWAGGCVRDELLGLVPKDYDVATSATPDDIRAIFGRRRTLAVGAAFGVITVLGPRAAGQIEVATFRTDAAYSDGRHPDAVIFTTAEHDAQRRDFTINGLFFDPVAQKIVDYVGGQEDIERRIVRAIGDARQRLREDRLRMLRAVRFAATFQFEIEPQTFAVIQEMAPDITSVSPERIGMEIRRMLLDPNRARAIQLLRDSRLLPHVLPEIADLSQTRFEETLRILSALREPTLSLALAALLSWEQRVGSTQRGVGSAERRERSTQYSVQSTEYGVHGTESDVLLRAPCSQLPALVGRRLRYTNKEIERAAWLLQQLPAILHALQQAWPSLQRILTHEGATELLALHEAMAGSDDPALAFCRERLAWPPERLNPPPLLDGAALIAHGLAPGPQFAQLLEQVRDAQLEGRIQTRDEALALVDRLRSM
ncbi:MAG TPA: CCA tRNA nucleotidyltransferase [Lacipirellulaceae bacterium]|nr:CCA tRNA nucleotidyltransferase [Lacipirellulaceae bacterium]